MPPREPPDSADAKRRGAYYTGSDAAAALCAWAITGGADRAFDPSFGAGVFLEAAAARLASLGGSPAQVHGAEVDAVAHGAGVRAAASAGIPPENLALGDFFGLEAEPAFDAVVGNPPFIRFQRFTGPARDAAVARAREAGAHLSPLSSSWAPFVVHAAEFVRPGGRLAMVVPHEIGHTDYGRAVLGHVAASFERVVLVAFCDRLFPDLDQDTLALLAAGRGSVGRQLRYTRIRRLDDLPDADRRSVRMDEAALVQGRRSVRFWEMPHEVRDLYETLERDSRVRRLGELAQVTSGYVTGANRYFHLSPAAASERGLAAEALVPAVFRAHALGRTEFDHVDWLRAADGKGAGYLFRPPDPPDAASRHYLELGERLGIHEGYKARHRSEWYRVPRVFVPDLLLPGMAAATHGLAVNRAGVAAANTLYGVTLHGDPVLRPGDRALGLRARAMAVAWLTSLSRLARELEGRVLGGGMLKLEPGGAARILLPGVEHVEPEALTEAAAAIDAHLARGHSEGARSMADELLLGGVLGLPADLLEGLRTQIRRLDELRRHPRRGSGPRPGS